MKNVSIGLALSLIIVLCAISSASAAWVSLGGDQGVTVTVLESTPSRITLDYRVGGFEKNDLLIDGKTYSLVSLPGEAERLEAGLPDLPVVARSVIIPDDRVMKLRVATLEYTDLQGITPVPSKGNLLRTVDPSQVPFTFDAFYTGSSWYPEQDVTQRDPYVLRDYRGTTILVTPIRYQPSTGTLRVATHLVVVLEDAGPGGANVLVRQRPLDAINVSFDEIYRSHFANYGMQYDKYSMVPELGSMLVICYDAFVASMQPFVDWKNQAGIPTTLVPLSSIGTTATQIKTYIAAQYNASSNPKLAFVLLVGDSGQMPSPTSDGGSADPTYGKIVGNDSYPEIFVGRFSAENVGHVQTQVLRSVNYEKFPEAGADWYAKGTGIGSDQGPGDDGEFDYQHINVIRTKLLNYGYTQVDQIYDPGANSAMVANALNAGRSIANYCGHGSQNAWTTSGFSSTSVNALTNENRLPFIFSVACVNGQFANSSCFAEAWLRATHNGNPTGAVATYMSSINQSWNPPMAAEDEADNLLVEDASRTFGSLCFNGSCQMIDEYGADGASMFNTWIVFGDPSLRVRTATPTEIAVAHADSIPTETVELEVVTDCPGALCGLSLNGVYFGSGVADATGHALVVVTGTLAEGQDLTLTVTGYNRIPYIGTIPVRAPAPSLPLLVADPSSVEVTIERDSTDTGTFRLINMGGAAAPIHAQLDVLSHDEVGFLTVGADTANVQYAETTLVELRFNAGGFLAGRYTASVRIRCDTNQTMYVPVVMNVSDITSVDAGRGTPASLSFEGARPNPFAGSVTLHYALPAAQTTRLVIYDSAGRVVRTLVGGDAVAGYHSVDWNGRDDSGRNVPTGVYFARLQTASGDLTRRLLRIR